MGPRTRDTEQRLTGARRLGVCSSVSTVLARLRYCILSMMLHSHAGVIQHWQAFVLWLALRMDWLGLFLFFFFFQNFCLLSLPPFVSTLFQSSCRDDFPQRNGLILPGDSCRHRHVLCAATGGSMSTYTCANHHTWHGMGMERYHMYHHLFSHA